MLASVFNRLSRRRGAKTAPTIGNAALPDEGLTIVTPTFEGHYEQFARLIDSVRERCSDPQLLTYVVVVERANVERFSRLFTPNEPFAWRIVTTEEALIQFGVDETPAAFLKRVGKFTFQTLKKFVGLYGARTRWSLVLDSETLFLNPFSVAELVDDYRQRPYVFYSRTGPRGADWHGSTGHAVLQCCSAALSVRSTDRWYMEYFHWFYETAKLRDMIDHHLSSAFFADVRRGTEQRPYFELILYYLYLEKVHGGEYHFVDIFDELARYLPPEIARRFDLSDLPFSRFGNEYLLNVLRPEEVHLLAPFFAAYRLPFLRLEPPVISHRYMAEMKKLPSFRALVSSQHIPWLRDKIAICVTDGFAADDGALHAQLRELIGWLSGVECDLFVHGRLGLDEATIRRTLNPVAARFEQAPPDRSSPAADGREADRLWPLWSAARCFDLIERPRDYGFVVRVRPGLVGDLSLKEIMIAISDQSDVLPDTIYLPRAMHGHGVNVDLALGAVAPMRVYMHAYRHLRIDRAGPGFDVQVALLQALIEGEVRLVLAEMAYSDMGDEPPRIGATYHQFHRQFAHPWGRNEDLPLYKDVTSQFAAKLAIARAGGRTWTGAGPGERASPEPVA